MWQEIGECKRGPICADVEIGHDRTVWHVPLLEQAPVVAHRWVAIHPIQPKQRIKEEDQPNTGDDQYSVQQDLQAEENARCAQRDAHREERQEDLAIVTTAYVNGSPPVPPV